MESISFINKKNHKFSETEQEKLIKYKLLSKDNPRFFELCHLIMTISLLKNFDLLNYSFEEDKIQDFFSEFINDNAFDLTKTPNLNIKVLLSKENNTMFYSKLYHKYTSHLLKLIDSDNRYKKKKKSVKYFFIDIYSFVFFVSEITKTLYKNKILKNTAKEELTKKMIESLGLKGASLYDDRLVVMSCILIASVGLVCSIVNCLESICSNLTKDFLYKTEGSDYHILSQLARICWVWFSWRLLKSIKNRYVDSAIFSKIVNQKSFCNKDNLSLQEFYIKSLRSKICIKFSKKLNNTKEENRKLEKIINPNLKIIKNKIKITKISEIKQSFLEVFSVPTIREMISILRDLEKQILKLTVEDAASFKIFVLSKQKDLNKKLLKLKVGVKEKSKLNKIIQKFIPDNALLEKHFRGLVDKYRHLSLINNFLFVMQGINRANNLIQKTINRKKNILLQIFFERYKLNIDSLEKDNTNSSLENNSSGFGVIYTSNVLDVANLEHKILKDSLDRIYSFILTYGYSENDGANISDIKVLNRLLLIFVSNSFYGKSSESLQNKFFCKDLDWVLIETIAKHAFWAEDNEYYNGIFSANLSQYGDRSMEESSCVFIERLLKIIPENDKATIRQKKKDNSSYSDHTGTFDNNNWKYKYTDYKKKEIFIKLHSRLRESIRESIESPGLDFNVYLNMYLLSKFCIDSRIMLENPGVDFTTMMDAGHNRCSEDLHGNNIKKHDIKNNIIKYSKKVLKDKAHQYINTKSLVHNWCVLFDKIAGNLELKKVTDVELDKSLLMQIQF